MAAPDLPPPPPHVITERPLAVHLHVKLVSPEALVGGVVIVIDAIRASATIAQAIASGATRLFPTLSIDDALRLRDTLAGDGGEPILLGGERGGVMPPGFDLDNSPAKYTSERVRGKRIVFSTTNGTAALLHARLAARVLVGSMVNVGAVSREVMSDPRPVHILCCGTRDEISQDDILPAGAMVELLAAGGRQIVSDDSARLARLAWRGAQQMGVGQAMAESRGGRNLHRIGLAGDVADCSRVDALDVVPEFVPSRGEIVRA
ncbi:MAG: 2-phosphosulfolactate phosphatase [Tepidisphaera sp.]|nr:2-phosphosulfolactate phosphatase [Tepidisphaera sp.]